MNNILLVCFNNIEFDARSQNMLKTYSDLKYKCSALHLSNHDLMIANVKIYKQPESNQYKYRQYLQFYRFVKKHLDLISPKICIASDLLSLIAICLSSRKTKIIYDSREIYSALAGLKHKFLKQKVLSILEWYCIKFCDKIIVTAHSDREYLLSLYKKLNIEIVKNFPPLNMMPQKTNLLRQTAHVPQNSPILLYQGALQAGRGLFEYINVISKLSNCYLVIIGDGPIKNQLINAAISKKVDLRVVFLSWVPYHKLLNLTAGADLGLAIIEPLSLSYYNALPNKLFEYMLSGIPVVASNLPEIKPVLKDVRLGICIDYKNKTHDVLSAVKYILKNKKLYNSDIIQDIAKKKFVWETQTQVLVECLNES